MTKLQYDRTKIDESFGFKIKSLFNGYSLMEGGIGIVGEYKLPDYAKVDGELAKGIHERAQRELMFILARKVRAWLIDEGYVSHKTGEEVHKTLPKFYEHQTIIGIVEPWKNNEKINQIGDIQ